VIRQVNFTDIILWVVYTLMF